MSKYNSKKVIVDDIKFDFRKEANRWFELRMLERAGKISNLQRQYKFVLIPTQIEQYERYGKTGKRLLDGQRVIEKECAYYADFVYYEDGKLVAEDVKGFRTEVYKIKRKMMLEKYGIRIKEI